MRRFIFYTLCHATPPPVAAKNCIYYVIIVRSQNKTNVTTGESCSKLLNIVFSPTVFNVSAVIKYYVKLRQKMKNKKKKEKKRRIQTANTFLRNYTDVLPSKIFSVLKFVFCVQKHSDFNANATEPYRNDNRLSQFMYY